MGNLKSRGKKVPLDIGPDQGLLTLVLGAAYRYYTNTLRYFREIFNLGYENEMRKLPTKKWR